MKSKFLLALAVLTTASFAFAAETTSADKAAGKAEKKEAAKDCCGDEECAKDQKAEPKKEEAPKTVATAEGKK